MELKDKIEKLPEKIKTHLAAITKSSGLPDSEDSFEKIAVNWIEKEQMFKEQIKLLNMIEKEHLEKDYQGVALILTNSGSLISIGTIKNNTRWAEYASIKLRADVPDMLIIDKTSLAADIELNSGIVFSEGPLKNTSAIYLIAVCKDDVSSEEQEKRIREAAIFLTNCFVKLNRTLNIENEEIPEQFNMKGMVHYISKKNNITIKETRQIIDDYLFMVECGVLLKERVSLGRLGNVSLKVKAAQKARVMKNPASGEEMTVKAKPEMYVPKISFSKVLKEKAENIAVTITED